MKLATECPTFQDLVAKAEVGDAIVKASGNGVVGHIFLIVKFDTGGYITTAEQTAGETRIFADPHVASRTWRAGNRRVSYETEVLVPIPGRAWAYEYLLKLNDVANSSGETAVKVGASPQTANARSLSPVLATGQMGGNLYKTGETIGAGLDGVYAAVLPDQTPTAPAASIARKVSSRSVAAATADPAAAVTRAVAVKSIVDALLARGIQAPSVGAPPVTDPPADPDLALALARAMALAIVTEGDLFDGAFRPDLPARENEIAEWTIRSLGQWLEREPEAEASASAAVLAASGATTEDPLAQFGGGSELQRLSHFQARVAVRDFFERKLGRAFSDQQLDWISTVRPFDDPVILRKDATREESLHMIVNALVKLAGVSVPSGLTFPAAGDAGGDADLQQLLNTARALGVLTGGDFLNGHFIPSASVGSRTLRNWLTRSGARLQGTAKIQVQGDLRFASTDVGTEGSVLSARIVNPGASPLIVYEVRAPDGFSVGSVGGEIAPGESRDVLVRFRPAKAGIYSGRISIRTNASVVPLAIACSGKGLTKVPVMTSLVDFGLVPVGTSDKRQIVVRNYGNAPLRLSSVSATEGFAVTAIPLPLEVGSGRAVTMEIVFSPQSATNYDGAISLLSDRTSGADSIVCRGKGVQVPASLMTLPTGGYMDVPLPESILGLGTPVRITGLPAGLSFSTANGRIRERPTTSGNLSYTIWIRGSDGKTLPLTIPVHVEPLPVWAVGSFTALVSPSQASATSPLALGGLLDLRALPSGAFTGRLLLGRQSFSIRGQIEGKLDSDRGSSPLESRVSVPTDRRDPGKNIEIILRFLPENSGSNPGLTGSLAYQGENIDVGAGWKHVWNSKTNPAWNNMDRWLNLALHNQGAVGPRGTGFARVLLAKSGFCSWFGTLADGRTFTGAFMASPSGDVPLYTYLAYPAGGSVTALLGTETPNGFVKTVEGSANGRWIKRGSTNASDRSYRDGFQVDLGIEGCEFSDPLGDLHFGASGVIPLRFDLRDGGVESAQSLQPFIDTGLVSLGAELQAKNRIVVTQAGLATSIKPSFNARTGAFSGASMLVDTVQGGVGQIKRTMSFKGLYIPDPIDPEQDKIHGFFTLPELPGAATGLTPIRSGQINLHRQEAAVPAGLLLDDDFGDGIIDPARWTHDRSTVIEEEGLLKVIVQVTDAGGRLASVPWTLPSKGFSLRRKAMVHYGNNYAVPNIRFTYPGVGEVEQTLCSVFYGNMSYSSSQNETVYGTFLGLGEGNPHNKPSRAQTVAGPDVLWDQWFTEQVTYDRATGLVQYFQNESLAASGTAAILPAGTPIIFKASAWGWYTGHWQYIDDVRIEALAP